MIHSMRMLHFPIPAFAAALLMGFAVSSAPATACKNPPQPKLETGKLTVQTLRGTAEFTVEQAVTAEEKACGLMKRPRLGPFEGMLFRQTPPAPAYFWMKNTPAPLDMIFLDRAGRVIHVVEHAVPYSTTARGTDLPTAGILELRAGSASRLALEIGDLVQHPWFQPSP